MEMMAKRSSELETVHNNASVLEDMLDHYKPGETSEEEKDLMKVREKHLYSLLSQFRY